MGVTLMSGKAMGAIYDFSDDIRDNPDVHYFSIILVANIVE